MRSLHLRYPAETVPFPQTSGSPRTEPCLPPEPESRSVANSWRGRPFNVDVFGHRYNFARYVGLPMPLERSSAFAAATFEFSETLEAYGQALYGDYSVRSRIAPVVAQGELMLPTTLHTGRPPTPPRQPGRSGRRIPVFEEITAIGPRDDRNEYDTLKVTAGLRGQLPRDWAFDAYAQYGAATRKSS